MKTEITNPEVDIYIAKAKRWREEIQQLRAILLECGLDEALKWGKPCYSTNAGNIAIIQDFKEYFALLFFKGILLKDQKGFLVKTGVNTHMGRQLRFSHAGEIGKMEPLIKAYVKDAVQIEKSGVKVSKERPAIILPDEFKEKFAKMPALKTAFNALTPGRQRAYNIYFTQPKQAATRISRIEKCLQRILGGKGLND